MIPTMKKPETQTKMIEIHDLIKIYKRRSVETSALRGLTCWIDKGHITVIMGPSGCGKTTLLNILGGISHPSAGALVVDGDLVSEFTDEELETYRLKKISYIFQQKNLIPTMTVWENITFIVEYNKEFTPENKKRIQNIIQFIDIEKKLKHFPNELSGGEQQRVALAVALAKNSPIILCDEPTGELDSAAKMKVMQLLKTINQKYPEKAIIVVSHDPDFKLIADRVLYMRDGRISYEESKEVLKQMQEHGLTPEGIGKPSTLQAPSNSSAIQELQELATTITTRLAKLQEQEDQKKEFNLEEKV